MSDDDRDIDVDSDEGDDSDSRQQMPRQNPGNQYFSQVCVTASGKQSSNIKKAAEYIQFMRRKNTSHQQDIEDLKRQNNLLEAQIRTLEKAKVAGSYIESVDSKDVSYNETESDTSDVEGTVYQRRVKKMKISTYQ